MPDGKEPDMFNQIPEGVKRGMLIACKKHGIDVHNLPIEELELGAMWLIGDQCKRNLKIACFDNGEWVWSIEQPHPKYAGTVLDHNIT